MKILDILSNLTWRTKQSFLWVAFASAASMGTLAVIMKIRKGNKVIEPIPEPTTEELLNSNMIECDFIADKTDDEVDSTNLLVEQLLNNDNNISLLVTISNRIAENPNLECFQNEDFIKLLIKLCNSKQREIRMSALLAICNFCRMSNIVEHKVLLNVLFARLRYTRYMQNYDELASIMNCLSNLALNSRSYKYFLPSLEILGEIISHQGNSSITKARVSAWKILVNLSNISEIMPELIILPWQWLVAIKCDEECELRRMLYIKSLLDYFMINKEIKPIRGSILAVLISPITYNTLKQKFDQSIMPQSLHTVSQSLIAKFTQVHKLVDGPARLTAAIKDTDTVTGENSLFTYHKFSNCFYKSPLLCPDPKHRNNIATKRAFPHLFDHEWTENDLITAVKNNILWYNTISSRCVFSFHDLPSKLEFEECEEVEDFIGENSGTWIVGTDYKTCYKPPGYLTPLTEYIIPKAILEPLLEEKNIYIPSESILVIERLNLILDELALLCAPFYTDLMLTRETAFINILPEYKRNGISSRQEEDLFILSFVALPDSSSIVPHRPFVFEKKYDVEEENQYDESLGKPYTEGPLCSTKNRSVFELMNDNLYVDRKTIDTNPKQFASSKLSESNSYINTNELSTSPTISEKLVQDAFIKAVDNIDNMKMNSVLGEKEYLFDGDNTNML